MKYIYTFKLTGCMKILELPLFSVGETVTIGQDIGFGTIDATCSKKLTDNQIKLMEAQITETMRGNEALKKYTISAKIDCMKVIS